MSLKYYLATFLAKFQLSAIKKSKIHRTSKIEGGSHIVNSSFGKYSFCGRHCEIINTDIGSFCSIANNVVIGGAMHPLQWVSTSPVFYRGRDSIKKKFSNFERPMDKRTSIGNDVWIGESAIIKQGVSVGDGAIIGMGSIVTHDVPPYSISAGNPAREVRKRFPQNQIDCLLEIKWWDLGDDQLAHYAENIKNPEKFIDMVKQNG